MVFRLSFAHVCNVSKYSLLHICCICRISVEGNLIAHSLRCSMTVAVNHHHLYSASSLVRADAGGSAPQRRDTVRRKPNDASKASQLRSINQRGLPPHKKDHPGTPAVRLNRRSVKGKYRRRTNIHPSATQAQPCRHPYQILRQSLLSTLRRSSLTAGVAGHVFVGRSPFG
jgi:hypothetical protein